MEWPCDEESGTCRGPRPESDLVRSKELKGLSVSRCFKFRSKIGMETAIQALHSAYCEKRATMDELWRAAKVCRVVNVMRPYMEFLI